MRQALLAAALLLTTPDLLAQAPALALPQASPAASLKQVVGITEIEVTYHRPAAQGRKVWDGLVPYGEVWRAGANETTTVAFSTPVTVGGTVLAAGRYGLHMIPTPTTWTVAFSRHSTGWGSYSYDPKEDAARLQVTPLAGEAGEWLAYTLDDPTPKGVTLTLRWAGLRVPVPIGVDTPAAVVASLRDQLRGLAQFFPQTWSAAAAWCLRQGVNLDEAQVWADRSLAIQATFAGLRVKAALLERKGDGAQAQALREKAYGLASEGELNQAGYELLAQGKVDAALGLFRRNVQAHPDSWNVHDSLGEALAAKGDRTAAAASYREALARVTAPDQKARIERELAKLK